MNYLCKEFIQIDKRKWNDVRAFGTVVHDVDLADREIDGSSSSEFFVFKATT